MKFKTGKSPLAAGLNYLLNLDYTCFYYGTIEGVFNEKPDVFEILLVINNRPHNGHFKKFMRFITDYCKREHKKLAFLEVWSEDLRRKLLKEGFTLYPHDGLVKEF